ncbi:MAG: hypothetical protein HQL05_01155 [Nitrospirae bacterium]|nr:hypothetical protein [Nitrospirota bacterium]
MIRASKKLLATTKMITLIIALVLVSVAALSATETYSFVTKWGSFGSGDGQFYHPSAVAIDASGNVLIADSYNNRIQKFTSSGTFITTWGSGGSGDGQFNYDHAVAIDGSGNIYVTDTYNDRIQKFTPNGTFITKWGSNGSGDGQFYWPHGIAFDSLGNIYIVEQSNHRVQKFTSSGTFITKWGSLGSGDGQFDNPHAIAVDASDNVYVSDHRNYRIQKFTSSGTFMTKWGSQGSGDGQFDLPLGVAVDSSGNVYVADAENHRIQKFTSNGVFITKWGSSGSGDGQFSYPRGIAVNASGSVVYIADNENSRIQKFTSSGGSYTLDISLSGTGDGTVTSAPAGINCGSTCSASFAAGTSVTLTATASDNATFAGWSWDCTGTTSTCTLTMSAAKEVTATFNAATEEQGPGGNDPNYDGNGDGTPDRLQGNVESFHAANLQYITVAADPSVNISTISSVTTPDLGGLGLTTGNAGSKLPVGTLSFTLTGVQTGAVNQVKFYLPRGVVVNHVKKYGTSGWYDFDCNGKFRGTPCGEISGGRNNPVVTLYLIDNQLGDIDSTVGTIQDPVALLSPAQVTYTLPYLHTNPVNVTYCVISNMTADTSTVGVELTATAAGNMSSPTNDLITTMTTANKQINPYQTRMLTFNGKDISLDTNVIGSIPEVAPKSSLYGSYGASIVITSESTVDPVGLSCGSVPMACFQGDTLPKRNLVGYLCTSNNFGALGGTGVFTY